MNKLYLLFIIFMIILFYLYINNISIEFFDTIPELDGLPAADLGPIQFVDSQGVELGRYPLYSDKDPSLQDTVITINDGSPGDTGPPATTQQPAVCYGDVNLRTITGNQLDVFTDKLNLKAKEINFDSPVCFDNNGNCITSELINNIQNNHDAEQDFLNYKQNYTKTDTEYDNVSSELDNYKIMLNGSDIIPLPSAGDTYGEEGCVGKLHSCENLKTENEGHLETCCQNATSLKSSYDNMESSLFAITDEKRKLSTKFQNLKKTAETSLGANCIQDDSNLYNVQWECTNNKYDNVAMEKSEMLNPLQCDINNTSYRFNVIGKNNWMPLVNCDMDKTSSEIIAMDGGGAILNREKFMKKEECYIDKSVVLSTTNKLSNTIDTYRTINDYKEWGYIKDDANSDGKYGLIDNPEDTNDAALNTFEGNLDDDNNKYVSWTVLNSFIKKKERERDDAVIAKGNECRYTHEDCPLNHQCLTPAPACPTTVCPETPPPESCETCETCDPTVAAVNLVQEARNLESIGNDLDDRPMTIHGPELTFQGSKTVFNDDFCMYNADSDEVCLNYDDIERIKEGIQ